MTSLQKRKNLVNQLRKAHFPLGFEGNKDITTQYVEKYRQYEIKGEKVVGSRASNVQIGQGSQNKYQSQFQQKFPQHQLPKRQKFKPNQNNNIVLGYNPDSKVSSYNQHFLQHRPGPPKSRLQPHTKPNIQLGDALTDFATSYNVNHNQKELPLPNPSGMDIRKTNMILGNDATNYVTQSNFSYQGHPGTDKVTLNKDYGSNISLGTGNGGFGTENKQNFAHKEVPYCKVDKEVIRDFKNSHFHFGFPTNNQHSSQNHQQFSQKPINFVKAQAHHKPNVDLKLDDNNYFDTTYGKEFQGKEGEKRAPLTKSGEINSVMLGAYQDPQLYQTQAKGQYVNKDFIKSKLVKHPNNLDFGGYPQQFLTHYQATHFDKFNQLQKNKLSDDEILKLKAKNFVTGFQDHNYQLSSQTYGKSGKQDPIQEIKIPKSSNIIGQNNNYAKNSIYKSSFGWKKNDQF